MSELAHWTFLLNIVLTIANVGLTWRAIRGEKQLIRGLLWIICKRIKMGQFYSPFEKTIVVKAIEYVG
jgi:hypothetical protein